MSAAPRRLLLVAYHFPPMGGSGVQRPLKLARDLPRHGWLPTVLCAGHARYPLEDVSLCGEIPSTVKVERLAGYEPAGLALRIRRAWVSDRYVLPRVAQLEQRLYWGLDRAAARLRRWLPEPELLWTPPALGRAVRIIRRDRLAALVTSGPPFSVHQLGLLLQKRLGIPWIAEFRDPLLSNFGYDPGGPLPHAFWQSLERRTVTAAQRIVVTCPEAGDDLLRRYPALPPERVATIPNGFDPADFPPPTPHQPFNGPFVLTHVGSFYGRQSIQPILEAMRLWRARHPLRRHQTRLELVGAVSATQARLIRAEDHDFVHFRGYQPHAAAVAAMRAASALLLTVPDCQGGRLCIPAKTFEYLATDRPILALVPPGTALHRLLQRAGGVLVPADRAPTTLADALDQLANGRACCVVDPARRRDVLKPFRRSVLAARYAGLLDAAVARLRLGDCDTPVGDEPVDCLREDAA